MVTGCSCLHAMSWPGLSPDPRGPIPPSQRSPLQWRAAPCLLCSPFLAAGSGPVWQIRQRWQKGTGRRGVTSNRGAGKAGAARGWHVGQQEGAGGGGLEQGPDSLQQCVARLQGRCAWGPAGARRAVCRAPGAFFSTAASYLSVNKAKLGN